MISIAFGKKKMQMLYPYFRCVWLYKQIWFNKL